MKVAVVSAIQVISASVAPRLRIRLLVEVAFTALNTVLPLLSALRFVRRRHHLRLQRLHQLLPTFRTTIFHLSSFVSRAFVRLGTRALKQAPLQGKQLVEAQITTAPQDPSRPRP